MYGIGIRIYSNCSRLDMQVCCEHQKYLYIKMSQELYCLCRKTL